MITIGMNYEVLDGKEGVFENACRGVIAALEKAAGHDYSKLYQDTANRKSYLIMSQWSDMNAFNAFIRSEQFQKVTNWGKEQILAKRPSHQVYGENKPMH